VECAFVVGVHKETHKPTQLSNGPCSVPNPACLTVVRRGTGHRSARVSSPSNISHPASWMHRRVMASRWNPSLGQARRPKSRFGTVLVAERKLIQFVQCRGLSASLQK
jgi:hypothetical protein